MQTMDEITLSGKRPVSQGLGAALRGLAFSVSLSVTLGLFIAWAAS